MQQEFRIIYYSTVFSPFASYISADFHFLHSQLSCWGLEMIKKKTLWWKDNAQGSLLSRLLYSPFSFLIGIAPAVQLIGTPFPDESILELSAVSSFQRRFQLFRQSLFKISSWMYMYWRKPSLFSNMADCLKRLLFWVNPLAVSFISR